VSITLDPDKRINGFDFLAGELRKKRAQRSAISWPSPRYQTDPVAFFREIVGVEPWSRQIEIIEAVRDHMRVAVRSGHKVSKSHTSAGIALWYYCSFPDARVVMSSTTDRQVNQILWRELKMMRARGGRCTKCKAKDPDGRRITRPCPHSAIIDGEMGELARTGLKSTDFREVVGFTARQAEAVAGISGKHLLYILDEASGIPDEIFEAVEGNRAGGARVVMFSNPTRTSGEFFDAFYSKKDLYKTITVSSEETPNVVQGETVIPGLATRQWIEEKKEEWGEDSPLYTIRVKGEHALQEDGKIFSVHAIAEAERRWKEDDCPECDGTGQVAGETCPACGGSGKVEPAGRLFLGLDPAGPTGSGDESVFVLRRGLRMLDMHAQLGLNDDAHLAQIMGMLNKHRLPRETPVVVIDREGSIGSSLYGHVRQFLESRQAKPFDLVAVRSSDRAVRQPVVYDRIRDELCANLEGWIRDGGAILEDAKLSAELHFLTWEQSAANGRLKLVPKVKIRKELGRSPDRYDALSMAVWEPLSLRDDLLPSAKKVATMPKAEYAEATFDPYAIIDMDSYE